MKLHGVESDLRKIEQRLMEIEQERTKLKAAHKALQDLNGSSEPKTKETLAVMIKRILETAGVQHLPLREIHKRLEEMGHTLKGQSPRMSIYSALKRNPKLFDHSDKGWGLHIKNI